MSSKLTSALSEFSKGRWASEPSDEPPLHPSELNLAMRVRSWLARLDPLTFTRYLIAFFVGVIATVAWQSYRDGSKDEIVAAAPVNVDSVRQSIDKLSAEIAKLRVIEQDVLDKVSTPAPHPAAAPARKTVLRPPQTP
jgi:hypothetical protein